ncbi:hypothetical protein Ahy_A06g029245 [Arachis hypogaea]|uniref:Replication protein A 70 kDa DNA-binding subunit B/D first OB fold domain-containing protein n=1 Tax=Arachis hypogaea TaxID=3818 RepID=A0A445CSV8_ARAHY|nr:hypothetical protein Ahy_A06g029245 [Arachis hypogaea]
MNSASGLSIGITSERSSVLEVESPLESTVFQIRDELEITLHTMQQINHLQPFCPCLRYSFLLQKLAARKNFVRDINPNKLAWSLVVGVARLYMFSLELVLQDEKGDRIHVTIFKLGLKLFMNRIKEHVVYSMQNFIVKLKNGQVKTTPHKYKLNFYTKTTWAVLPIETFSFNPFKFRSFHELEKNSSTDENLLFDYIGEVVGKDKVKGLITRIGDETRHITLQLKDLEKRKIKCTLFRELVDEVLSHLQQDDRESFIMLKTQPQYSITDEINVGIVPVCTIEKICPKKVVQNKDRCDNSKHVGFKVMPRYKLQVIMTDGSCCLNFLVWNKKAEQMVRKTAEKVKELSLNITYKNINAVEGVYSVTKLSNDKSLMSNYSVANSSCDASYSQMLANILIAKIDEDSNGHAAVSLSKDFAVESNIMVIAPIKLQPREPLLMQLRTPRQK